MIATEAGLDGKVIQVAGPAVDIQFPEGRIPPIHNAVRITSEGFTVPAPIDIIVEVAQHIGEGRVRNLLRLVDALPSAYMVGIISILVTARSQRLGDLAAGTIVVRERPAELPRPLPPVDPSLMLPPQLAGAFRSPDILLARDFLRRAPTLLPARRDALRTQIATTLRARLAAIGQAPPANFTEDQFHGARN